MVVLMKASVADSSIRAAAIWFAAQVETGGSGLARDGITVRRERCKGQPADVLFLTKSVGVEDLLVDVRPVLFPEEVEAVNEVAGEPLLTDFGPGLILLGVIEGGDAGCGA